ncbi:MAG: hypothetical protein WBD54_14790, partial [Candidatus Acidiferrales bacterium]
MREQTGQYTEAFAAREIMSPEETVHDSVATLVAALVVSSAPIGPKVIAHPDHSAKQRRSEKLLSRQEPGIKA